MTVFTPEWKLTVGGVDYSDITISDVQHQSGRSNIYTQPLPSYMQVTLVALNNQTLPFDINDSFDLQVKDSTGSYVSLFGGDVTDVTVEVGNTGALETVIRYTIIAMGFLTKLTKEIWDDNISQDEDGNQIYEILSSVLLGSWNDVPAASQWSTYDPTETWENAINLGLGEIDQPGLYTMTAQSQTVDTIYNVVADIADSAFGYLYEDNAGNIGYADADHRQSYLLANGYVELDAGHALGAGLSTVMRSADVRNDIFINYGNNFNSQVTAIDANSIALYGYKAETINSRVQGAVDAQAIADRYIAQRAYPQSAFQSITFPITNSEIDNADRDDLLGVFMGMPVDIRNLPTQISGGTFQGYVEGWSWSTRFNELFLTINVSPTAFSQVAMRWNTVPITEAWNTIDNTLTWEYATIVA
jgi:citrate lyase gamma subunit